MKRIILMPVYNDWEAARHVIQRLDKVLGDKACPCDVLIVDDGSSVNPPYAHIAIDAGVKSVSLLRLSCNLGHQRAIAIGLSYIGNKMPCDEVVIMDADGEDNPEDVPRMFDALAENDTRSLVFAARRKRHEGLVFRSGYTMYKFLHRFLTGHEIRFGNFSALSFSVIQRLITISDLWNHYVAAVLKSRIPYVTILVDRSVRLEGHSRMNLHALILHGLSSFSVFAETVSVRLMLASALLMVILMLLIFLVIGIRLFTDFAIPGWASTIASILAVLFVQIFLLMAVVVLFTLHTRFMTGVIPSRDYGYFILDCETISDHTRRKQV